MTEGGNEIALGEAIANARRAAGFTQQELCQATKISYSTLAKIERGAIKSPSIFTVAQIAQTCGLSIESLLGLSSEGLGSLSVSEPVHTLLTAKNGVKFVYFDINGCIVRFFQRAFGAIAADTGVSPELVENTFWHYNDAACRGEMSVDNFNRSLSEATGKPVDWRKYYLEAVDPIMEMHDCITWASSQFKVGLLSNIMPGQIDMLLAEGLLPNVPYASIVDSSQVGFIKPETQIYEIATARAEVAASEILLVDDSRTNLMAAERQGWHVLWFDDFRPSESVDRVKSALEV